MTSDVTPDPETVAVDTPTVPFDEEAFKAELTSLIPHLRAFARSLCGNATLADDVAQDAMLKAWNARERYKTGTNMKAWTFTILRNQFYSIKRRSWRSSSLDQEVAEQTIVANDDVEKSMELNTVRKALGRLSDDQREAIILVGASGLSYEEAGQICGVAVGTVKSRVSRARTALLSIMEKGDFDNSADGIDALNAMSSILNEADTLIKS